MTGRFCCVALNGRHDMYLSVDDLTRPLCCRECGHPDAALALVSRLEQCADNVGRQVGRSFDQFFWGPRKCLRDWTFTPRPASRYAALRTLEALDH